MLVRRAIFTAGMKSPADTPLPAISAITIPSLPFGISMKSYKSPPIAFAGCMLALISNPGMLGG